MDSTFTPAPDGFEVREVPSNTNIKYTVYRVTFTPESTTTATPISNDYVHVGMICVFPWAPGLSVTVFAPKADAHYSWQTDDIDLGSFGTMDQALKTIAALTPHLWAHWLDNPDHVW